MNNPDLPTAKQMKQREPIATRIAQGRYADAPELEREDVQALPKSLVRFRLADLKRGATKP
jgi:hypothetical protein